VLADLAGYERLRTADDGVRKAHDVHLAAALFG